MQKFTKSKIKKSDIHCYSNMYAIAICGPYSANI